MFKNVALCANSNNPSFTKGRASQYLPRFLNERDKKPFFSDVLFFGFNVGSVRGYERDLSDLKANVKALHDHGIRAHFVFVPEKKVHGDNIVAEKAEIQMVCEKAVHHLIAECNFDGISLDVGAIGSFGEMRLDSKVFYEYFIKVLAFIKRNPKFTGKTLSYLSYQDTTYNAEAPFEADKEHNHQMADLIDEVHIVGSLTGDYVYTPGESGVKDDKYFKCGIPKDKYFTFGSFNVDDSGLAFNSALAQIKKNSQCRGITGIYHDAEEKISPPPTSPEQSSYWKNRLSYYSELLQAETSNKGDKVIMK